jgi:hypothetical protein
LARLYLIRRNIETFVGPLTIDAMRDAYKRMAFGLQDEVCGHAGEWVSFDDMAKLKSKYPDVAKIVSQDMLAGWGVSDNTGKRIFNEDTKQIFVSKRSRALKMAMAFFFAAVLAFAAALYFAGQKKLSGKLHNSDGIPSIEEVNDFVEQNDLPQAVATIDRALPLIVESSLKSKTQFASWIPFLRLYAFEKDGEVMGVSPKILRGNGASSAPIDCSVSIWRKRWKSSVKQWPAFLLGKKFIRAHWARVLAWDPHWIHRRNSKGWVQPKNFYQGCIKMAKRALEDVVNGNSALPGSNVIDWERQGAGTILRRLEWLSRLSSSGQAISYSNKPQDIITTWSCLEGAKDFQELGRCSSGTPSSEAAAAYFDDRVSWNVMRIATSLSGSIPEKTLGLIGTHASKLRKSDHFTRFDYKPEQKFIKLLVKQGGNADRAMEKIVRDYPEVQLAH